MRRNFFKAKRGVFVTGGLSRRYGPYLTTGVRRGPFKFRTSIGGRGHKISGTVRITKNTRLNVRRNSTYNRTQACIRYRNRRLRLR